MCQFRYEVRRLLCPPRPRFLPTSSFTFSREFITLICKKLVIKHSGLTVCTGNIAFRRIHHCRQHHGNHYYYHHHHHWHRYHHTIFIHLFIADCGVYFRFDILLTEGTRQIQTRNTRVSPQTVQAVGG